MILVRPAATSGGEKGRVCGKFCVCFLGVCEEATGNCFWDIVIQ